MTETSVRHSDLGALAAALQDQRTRSIDVVAPARSLTVQGGSFVLSGLDPVITADGVTSSNGLYTPTSVGDEGVADKLTIPVHYLRRLRGKPDLYDANVNGWLAVDDRKFLLRLLRGDGETETAGVLRAFLSDSYKTIDNFDVLLATLQGMKDAGVDNPTIQADLTDRRMYVRVTVPQIKAYAPDLLKGYRSPFTGQRGDECPNVFAGFVITNSETGNGSFSITPRLEIEVCNNGMTFAADAARKVHLGGRLDAGVVKVSETTQRANLALVTSQTTDAVRTFLDVDYVTAKVRELEKAAGIPVADPQAVIATVGKKLGFTGEQQKEILSHFILGGQMTAGGIMQAVTSAAQLQSDGDGQWDMESAALPAMAMAAAIR
jgi:hypothetical protein